MVSLALYFTDPRVEDWLLMRTPFPAMGFIAAYFVFLWIGPKFMVNRKALDLKPILIVYNFGLVMLSAYMFYEVGLYFVSIFGREKWNKDLNYFI